MTENLLQEPVGMAAPVPMGAEPDEYEFDELENATLERTGRRARLWGIVSVVVAALAGVGVLVASLALLPQVPALGLGALAVFVPLVIVHLAMAMYYVRAGNSLLAVVRTSGNDVYHLLNGVGALTNAFRIEVIVWVVSFVLGLLFTVGALVSGGNTP